MTSGEILIDKDNSDAATHGRGCDADAVPADDAYKTEKVTKAGRDDLDPDEGSD